MDTTCKVCRFDVSRYPATVEVDANAHTFYCPVCGQSFEPVTEIPGQDVFYDAGSRAFVKWATPAEAAQSEILVELPLNLFRLQVRARTQSYQQLFYDAVLVFVLDGEIAQNQLFAPPENCRRYGLNITERVLDPSDTFLELQFELKGGSRRYRVSLPAAVTRATTDAQAGRVNNGSALTVWPNFKRPEWTERNVDRETGAGHETEHVAWRDYFVQFATSDANIKLKSLRFVGETSEQEVTLDGSLPKGAVGFAPEYVEVAANISVGGGTARQYNACFVVELPSFPINRSATLSKRLRLAIDFGTSNTCMCYIVPALAEPGFAAGDRNDPKLLRLSSKNYEVVRGLQLGSELRYTWLPDMRGQELIPSELVFRAEPQTLLGQMTLVPVVDYTIPPLRWRNGEQRLICTGFKWKQATEPGAVQERYQDLQRMYLDLVLRMALAELVSSGPLSGAEVHPGELDLVYTYPLAMTRDRREELNGVFESVARGLQERTGITINVAGSFDESRAGETGVGVEEPGQRIYVDIGGGTTDLAVIEQLSNVAGRELLLVDSVRYAGNDFLSALADDGRGGHIATRPLIELQRRVRAAGRALEDLSVFGNNEDRKESAQRALERFLRGLTQYLARIIALRVNQLGENASTKTLHIYLLGNGWRFVLFLPRDPLANPNAQDVDIVLEEVKARLDKELKQFREATPPLMTAEPKFELHHPEKPKVVVAWGALEATRLSLEGHGQPRTFLGTPVKVMTPTGAVDLGWETELPHNAKAVIDRVSFAGGLVNFEERKLPDYQHENAPMANIQDVNIKRYVTAGPGQIVASAFNVYLERWYKNFLTGTWAKSHGGDG